MSTGREQALANLRAWAAPLIAGTSITLDAQPTRTGPMPRMGRGEQAWFDGLDTAAEHQWKGTP